MDKIEKLEFKKVKAIDGSELVLNILRIGDEESITVKQAAELLGVTRENVVQVFSRRQIKLVTLSYVNKKYLMEQGVITNKRGRPPGLVTKSQMKILVRHIDTPEANAVYDQVWTIAEDLEVNVIHHTKLAGLDDPQDLLTPDYLQGVLDNWRKDIAAKEIAQNRVLVLEDERGLTGPQYAEVKALARQWLLDRNIFPHPSIMKVPFSVLKQLGGSHSTASMPRIKFDEVVEEFKKAEIPGWAKRLVRQYIITKQPR